MYEPETIHKILSIQFRAVDHGAGNYCPLIDARGFWNWPADAERVSFQMLSYDPEDDTFAAWDGRSRPVWEQH